MMRFTAVPMITALAAVFVFSFATSAFGSPLDSQNDIQVPKGAHTKTDHIVTVDVTGRQVSTQVHEEVPEEATIDEDAVTSNVTERALSHLSVHNDESVDETSQTLKQLSVDEVLMKPSALSQVPSTKTELPTSDRIIRGRFVGSSAGRRTRCYRFRSYIIRAYYRSFRGYRCYGKIYHIRNFICVRPYCRALITYYRY